MLREASAQPTFDVLRIGVPHSTSAKRPLAASSPTPQRCAARRCCACGPARVEERVRAAARPIEVPQRGRVGGALARTSGLCRLARRSCRADQSSTDAWAHPSWRRRWLRCGCGRRLFVVALRKWYDRVVVVRSLLFKERVHTARVIRPIRLQNLGVQPVVDRARAGGPVHTGHNVLCSASAPRRVLPLRQVAGQLPAWPSRASAGPGGGCKRRLSSGRAAQALVRTPPWRLRAARARCWHFCRRRRSTLSPAACCRRFWRLWWLLWPRFNTRARSCCRLAALVTRLQA